MQGTHWKLDEYLTWDWFYVMKGVKLVFFLEGVRGCLLFSLFTLVSKEYIIVFQMSFGEERDGKPTKTKRWFYSDKKKLTTLGIFFFPPLLHSVGRCMMCKRMIEWWMMNDEWWMMNDGICGKSERDRE
jgi:hypothetical protein